MKKFEIQKIKKLHNIIGQLGLFWPHKAVLFFFFAKMVLILPQEEHWLISILSVYLNNVYKYLIIHTYIAKEIYFFPVYQILNNLKIRSSFIKEIIFDEKKKLR